MASKNFACNKEQSVADFSGSNRGNGNDTHAPVGLSSGNLFRELMKFDHDWSDVYQITKAELVLTRTGEVHVEFGGSPRIVGRRISSSWNENGGAENSWSTSASTHWGNKPTSVGYGSDLALASTSADGTSKLDVTDILEVLAPATVLRRDGSPCGGLTNLGIEVRSYDEGSSSRTAEFYSWRAAAAKRPYIKLTYSDNHPPQAPTITSDVGSTSPAIVGTTAGTEDTTAFLFVDEDAGDTCAKVQVQYYSAGATDAAPGTVVIDTGAVTPTGAGSLNAYTVRVTGLPARTQMRKRLRTQDDKGAWSDWTSLADGFIQTAYKVAKPASPYMESDPDRPHVYGTISSPDTGDFITGWEGEFYRDDPSGTVTLWAPGVQGIGGSPTRSDVEYSGSTLSVGDVVRWRHRHVNRDGVAGEWSEFYSRTMESQTGPATMTPSDTGTKLTSRTAQLTIGHTANFDGYRWRLYRAGVLLYDSGVQAVGSTASQNVNIPAGVAVWGDSLTWDAAIRLTGSGTMGDFSPQRSLYINSLPSTTLEASE